MQKVDKTVEKVAKLVSQATDLPAISMASRQTGATVKRFELIEAGQGSVILAVMLTNEEVVNKLIKLPSAGRGAHGNGGGGRGPAHRCGLPL